MFVTPWLYLLSMVLLFWLVGQSEYMATLAGVTLDGTPLMSLSAVTAVPLSSAFCS